MQNLKIVLTTMLLIAILLLGLNTNSYARGGYSSFFNYNIAPVPNFPPPAPSWFPHSFPHIWSADEVVNVFSMQNLEVKEPEIITETDRFGLPASVGELIKFSIPSIGKNIQGCILSFEFKDNLIKNSKYYIDLNDKGQPYTWSFLKDNILLVIDGAVPEEKAKQYESALTKINQKQ